MPSLPEVDRLSITTVVDNFIDNLRADEKVAKRFTHAQARRMPTLKAEHGLSHGAANRVALVALDAMAEKADSLDPEAALYAGAKAELLPIHARLMALVHGLGSDIETAPKKGYVSLRRRKQFAMIKPAAKHVDLGLILPATPVSGRLESAATFNALFTHRVRIRSLEDIDDELATWLGNAYGAAA